MANSIPLERRVRAMRTRLNIMMKRGRRFIPRATSPSSTSSVRALSTKMTRSGTTSPTRTSSDPFHPITWIKWLTTRL